MLALFISESVLGRVPEDLQPIYLSVTTVRTSRRGGVGAPHQDHVLTFGQKDRRKILTYLELNKIIGGKIILQQKDR